MQPTSTVMAWWMPAKPRCRWGGKGDGGSTRQHSGSCASCLAGSQGVTHPHPTADFRVLLLQERAKPKALRVQGRVVAEDELRRILQAGWGAGLGRRVGRVWEGQLFLQGTIIICSRHIGNEKPPAVLLHLPCCRLTLWLRGTSRATSRRPPPSCRQRRACWVRWG